MSANVPVATLLDQARKYGPLVLERDCITCQSTVPLELQDSIAERYFEAQALLQEWSCELSGQSKVVAIAEAIARDNIQHTTISRENINSAKRAKNRAKRKRSRPSSSQVPFRGF